MRSTRSSARSAGQLRTRWALAALSLACAAIVTAPGCDLVVDATADSCTTDADCVNYANTACDTEQGICVSLDKCASSADCPSDQICRHFSPRECVSLKTPPLTKPVDADSDEASCDTIYPDDEAIWRDDSTILIGVTSPRSYVDDSGAVIPTIDTITNGAILAVDEINEKGGIDNAHKLALVICDDHGYDNFAKNNGLALASMGVQSMVGAAYSSQTKEMATPGGGGPGTVAAGVLAISSSATSPEITGIEDHAPSCIADCNGDATCEKDCPGLVWRTAPSDSIQSEAINAYFKDLEPIVKNRSGTEQTTIKVTVLHKDDDYGRDLAKYINDGLSFNGMKANLQPDAFHVRNYGSADKPADSVIQAAIADKADVYMLFATYTELKGVIPQLDAGAVSTELEPYYFISDGGLNDDMIQDIVAAGAQSRTRGTIPGTRGDLFINFQAAYNARFPDPTMFGTSDTFGVAGAYDAIYLMTYSAIAAKDAPLTGERLARGLAKTSDITGRDVAVGPLAYGQASSDLRDGKAINFDGASGHLDFDLQTGEARSDIQVWCVNDAGATPRSGRYYDSTTNKMAGAADSGTCPF
ncbi:MAG TPA: ABC transporter substrate-binding protein [Polyangiaceae bacterium]|jgi:branched-chain amino acid transport system substrate-binding protein|nr:ABC transporter substrate-binding protein [Polyangiaceae bacterium]